MICRLGTNLGKDLFDLDALSRASDKYRAEKSVVCMPGGVEVSSALSVFSGCQVGQAERKKSPELKLILSVKDWESSWQDTKQFHSQVPDEV